MLVLLGVNHASAPLEFRERLAFSEEELPAALGRLLADGTFLEAVMLSTCNRVEVLALARDSHGAPEAVEAFLARERGVSSHEIRRYSYRHANKEVVRHLFEVASGLDSMILGEPQILGQVKQAYRVAREAGTTGSLLERLLQHGLATAKRVRHETGVSKNAISIAYAAVELARKIFDDLAGRQALLLGAGKMSELAARHLAAAGVRLTVASRTFQRAAVVAERLKGEPVHWDAALAHLRDVDIVVSGTAAPGIVLEAAPVREVFRHRRGRPLFFIDIAVPRDIDPAVNRIDGAYLYDVDDLQGVVDSNLEERKRAAGVARELIAAEVESFERWRSSLQITPAISALRERLQRMGQGEVERFRRRLAGLSPEQHAAVEELAKALVQKILHRPITRLKSSAERGDASRTVALYKEIFGIPDDLAEEPGEEQARAGEEVPPGPRRILPGGREG
jgi:glutamyl-tRNA reductase